MPSRSNIFVTGYHYHVYNKTLDDLKPFTEGVISNYFLHLLHYYKHTGLQMSYSQYLRLKPVLQEYFHRKVESSKLRVEVVAYCLMPNHYHLLLKQKTRAGVSKYMADVTNGLTRFYNIMHKRKGPLFLPSFRSKPIMDEELLIHVSRYVHLNPYTSGLISSKEEMWTYPYSSAKEYSHKSKATANPTSVLELGYFLGSREKYRKFVENEAEHGKTRTLIRYAESCG